jgi:transposase-like protein
MNHIFAKLFVILFQRSLETQLTSEACSINTNHKIACPRCASEKTIKNGSTHNGKAKNKCKDCGRQFVLTID